MRQSESRDKILEVHPAARAAISEALKHDLTNGQLRFLLAFIMKVPLFSRKGDYLSLVEFASELGLWDKANGPPPRQADGSQHNILKVLGRHAGALRKKGIIDYSPATGKGQVGWFGLLPLDPKELPVRYPLPESDGVRDGAQKTTRRSIKNYRSGPHIRGSTEDSRSAGSRQPAPEAPAGFAERLATLSRSWGPENPNCDVADQATRVAYVVSLAPDLAPTIDALLNECLQGPRHFDEYWQPHCFLFYVLHSRVPEWPKAMDLAAGALYSSSSAGMLAEALGKPWREVAVECGYLVDRCERAVDMMAIGDDDEACSSETIHAIVEAVVRRGEAGEVVVLDMLFEEARKFWAPIETTMSFDEAFERTFDRATFDAVEKWLAPG